MSCLPMTFTKTFSAALFSSMFLAACGGGSTSQPANPVNPVEPSDVANAVDQGVVVIDQSTDNPPVQGPAAAMALDVIDHAALVFLAEETGPTGLTVSARAGFYALATPLVEEPVLRSLNMLDSCEVGSESSQINADALDLPVDHLLEAVGDEIFQVAAISAGDTIEMTTDTGSYLSLNKNDQSGDINYLTEEGADLTMAVPNLLNISVAGDEFPALESAWATPARLDAGIRDAVRSIANGPVVTWDAATVADSVQSRLHIYAGFLDEVTGEFTSFQCELADDGEFTLPADVQALYVNGSSANFVDVARYTRSVQVINDISVVSVFLQRF